LTNGNINDFNSYDEKDVKFIEKTKEIIFDSIKKINLDLTGLVILTEAATGNWIFTPLIAAFSNAKKVICFTKDSKYGSKEQIIKNFKEILQFLKLDGKIHTYTKRDPKIIYEADIITNIGLVRPINKKFIQSMKETAVISLMWEPWEFREEDIDLFECWKKQIPILGVNEHNSILDIMKYDGQAIIKIIKDHKITLENKKVILVGENLSALYMYNALHNIGSKVFLVSRLLKNECEQMGIKVIGKALQEEQITPYLKDCDVIIINSIPIKDEIIGEKTLNPNKLKKLSPNVSIFVYFGQVDYEKIKLSGLLYFPTEKPKEGHMSWTIDILGSKPTIELNSLGLKVGEILAKNRLSGNSKLETERISLKSPFCLDFNQDQKNNFNKKI